jgi:hypothetical protein
METAMTVYMLEAKSETVSVWFLNSTVDDVIFIVSVDDIFIVLVDDISTASIDGVSIVSTDGTGMCRFSNLGIS